jgi:ribosomal protein S18 acetylase RimI-like enzyme
MTGSSASSPVELRELKADSPALEHIADLHMELLDYGPMAALGRRFVRDICYRAHMREDLLRVVLATIDGQPAGFVAYTPYSIGFHRGVLSKYWFKAGLVLATSLIERPSRVLKVARAIRVLLSRRGETVLGSDPLGEVVCVAVRKQYLAPKFVRATGVRLSELLIRHAQQKLAEAGATRMRMIVDADNKPVLMLYHLMGAHFEPYEQAGEPRVHVWFDTKPAAEQVH